MRIVSFVTAILVTVSLYFIVLDRDTLFELVGRTPATSEEAAPDAAAPEPVAEAETGTSDERPVSVVALHSTADAVGDIVVLRGQTEAARQVDVRAETSGRVISNPLRKGTYVSADDLMCVIDPGTREIALAEATARLAEAKSRLPEAEAFVLQANAGIPAAQSGVAEAEARVREANINLNAAKQLSEGGFASDTRVASAEAAAEAALAGVEAAKSRLEGARATVESAKSGVESARAGIQSAEAAVAAAKKEIERLEIRAPFAGLLETDSAELGALLQPGSLCATIIQLDPIKLVGFVPETEVNKVSLGSIAGARLSTGDQVQGEVTFLARAADPSTRTFRLEVEIPNADLKIRDGQTVEMIVSSGTTTAHLLPQSALTLSDDGTLGVRTIDSDKRAGFTPVTVLRDTVSGIWLTGLPEQADVIVVGQEYVTDGVPVIPSYEEALQ